MVILSEIIQFSILTKNFPWELFLFLYNVETFLFGFVLLQWNDYQGIWLSLSSEHGQGQPRLFPTCSATNGNSLLLYTIDLLPPSPNSQAFVELLNCSTSGLSALLLVSWCQPQIPHLLGYCALRQRAYSFLNLCCYSMCFSYTLIWPVDQTNTNI